MKICIAHNRYQQAGGEDRVVNSEAEMLASHGHAVELLSVDNEAIQGAPAKAAAALSSMFSVPGYLRTTRLLRSFRPDILHVHNFMPTLSPAVFYAASAARVPVVHTLHNYRMLCANAQLFRNGSVCEECVQSRSFRPGVQHACYRRSRLGSAAGGGTVALHAALGTWDRHVARYIALTTFAAEKLGSFRVPPGKIRVKPNFVADRGIGEGSGGFALFVGRLGAEKGLETLLRADASGQLPMPVYLAGDGPEREQVERACARPGSRLVALGAQNQKAVERLMRDAAVLLVPSLWYEGFPMVIVEALSLGLPVIASRIGGLPEIVEEGVSGLLHSPGDAAALSRTMEEFAGMAPAQRLALRAGARRTYLERFSEVANYRALMTIYTEATAVKTRALQLK